MIAVSSKETTTNHKFPKQTRFQISNKELSIKSVVPPNAYQLSSFTDKNSQTKQGFKFGQNKRLKSESD